MHAYVLKGILLNGCSRTNEIDFKRRVFDAIAFQGFTHSSYSVIGVDFGLGRMDLTAEETGDGPAVVRIQVWNINQNPRFIFAGKTFFMSGSRFAVIPYIQSDDSTDQLLTAIRTVQENAHCEVNFGLIIMGTGKDGRKLDAVADVLEKRVHLPVFRVASMEDLLSGLVSASIKQEQGIFMFDLGDVPQAPLERARNLLDPFSSPVCLASESLFSFLEENGLHLDELGQAILNTNDKQYIFKIDLHNMKLHVAHRDCESCTRFPCQEAFTKICIVLNNTEKRGFASKSTGFTEADVFVLSILYALENNIVPASISNQFPPKKSCKQSR